ncbi:hypothetical protein BJ912DRAFT_1054320 [Pholiota molesta]|nr:hypothetical protein BJ912DRAFT_1054320 [Pholiota molesta]
MATFAEAQREQDEIFYATFPDARKALADDTTVFVYQPTDCIYAPPVELHYDYGGQYEYEYQYPPSTLAVTTPVAGPSNYPGASTLAAASTSLEHLRELHVQHDHPALAPLRTPPLQQAYYIPHPEGHLRQDTAGHHQQPAQHQLHALPNPRRNSHPYTQSPVDAYSPTGHFSIPPNTPSDLSAASPRSDNEDFGESIVRRGRPALTRGVPTPRSGRQQPEYPARSLTHPQQSARGLSWDPQSHAGEIPDASVPLPPQRLSPLPSKRILEKKPPLACLFCRGRKIACGPPLPGSTDKTCNQCQRRSLTCEYPAESRRGMRKKKTASDSDATQGADTVDSKDFVGAPVKASNNPVPVVSSPAL